MPPVITAQLRIRASTIKIPCCHGMNKIDLAVKYEKTHPEYFALRKDGTRCTNFTGYHSSRKGYPCFRKPHHEGGIHCSLDYGDYLRICKSYVLTGANHQTAAS